TSREPLNRSRTPATIRDISKVPPCYHDLKEVFNKAKAMSLPPHREWDCAIDLLPGSPIPKARLYSISSSERKAMEEYIETSLRSGIIRPSSSVAGAGFFFVDDILIFSPNLATHQRHVRQVLICLLEDQLYVKAEKCDFHASSVSFLGYVITANNISMDPAKVSACYQLAPTHFKKKVDSRRPKGAFQRLKDLFTTAPVLTVPDPAIQFVVEVDASNEGVGAVLSQRSTPRTTASTHAPSSPAN
ncbi:hypothetical protein L3Q82_020355, partial [Scortum barcoo]